MNNLSMCREAIPLAGRFRPGEVLPECTRIAQVIYIQFLRCISNADRGNHYDSRFFRYAGFIGIYLSRQRKRFPLMRTASVDSGRAAAAAGMEAQVKAGLYGSIDESWPIRSID